MPTSAISRVVNFYARTDSYSQQLDRSLGCALSAIKVAVGSRGLIAEVDDGLVVPRRVHNLGDNGLGGCAFRHNLGAILTPSPPP